MRVTFERMIVLEGGPEKLEKFLGENSFVYWVKGPNWEIWNLAPNFIRERYEGHFYLVDFDGESFLLASTVPLKIPLLNRKLLILKGNRESVAKRTKLHFIDPLNRRIGIQKNIRVDLIRLSIVAVLSGALLWINPYLFGITVLLTVLGAIPGDTKFVLRKGEKITVFKRNKRAVQIGSLIWAGLYLTSLIPEFQKIYRDTGNPRDFLVVLLILNGPVIILALAILYLQREWKDLV